MTSDRREANDLVARFRAIAQKCRIIESFSSYCITVKHHQMQITGSFRCLKRTLESHPKSIVSGGMKNQSSSSSSHILLGSRVFKKTGAPPYQNWCDPILKENTKYEVGFPFLPIKTGMMDRLPTLAFDGLNTHTTYSSYCTEQFRYRT